MRYGGGHGALGPHRPRERLETNATYVRGQSWLRDHPPVKYLNIRVHMSFLESPMSPVTPRISDLLTPAACPIGLFLLLSVTCVLSLEQIGTIEPTDSSEFCEPLY